MHAAEMGEMGHIAASAGKTGEQFNGSEDNDHPLGFHGYRREYKLQDIVGEHHAVGEQQAVDGARGTDSRHPVDGCLDQTWSLRKRYLKIHHKLVDQTGAYTAYHII